MFRSLLPYQRLLATTFLVVFVNVFAGQCYCATTKAARETGAAQVTLKAPAKPAHPGCHGHGAAARPPQKHADHSRPTSDQHDCCKDKSASLLSSLTTPVEKQFFTLAPALLPTSTAFHFRPAASPWNRASAVTLVLPEHLPPKIPDIRIFIQSLTV